jgi:hypothetical protein
LISRATSLERAQIVVGDFGATSAATVVPHDPAPRRPTRRFMAAT